MQELTTWRNTTSDLTNAEISQREGELQQRLPSLILALIADTRAMARLPRSRRSRWALGPLQPPAASALFLPTEARDVASRSWVRTREESKTVSEKKDEGTQPGDPAWVRDPELQRQMMTHLYLQAGDEGRALMAPLFEQAGLPIPFPVGQPPDQVTPKMATFALTQLLQQSAMLGRENARVSLGVSQIDQELGAQMIPGFFLAFKSYQDLLKSIIEQLKVKDKEQSSS